MQTSNNLWFFPVEKSRKPTLKLLGSFIESCILHEYMRESNMLPTHRKHFRNFIVESELGRIELKAPRPYLELANQKTLMFWQHLVMAKQEAEVLQLYCHAQSLDDIKNRLNYLFEQHVSPFNKTQAKNELCRKVYLNANKHLSWRSTIWQDSILLNQHHFKLLLCLGHRKRPHIMRIYR